ncbi:MAG: DUF2817 domain-containing protein [Phycisphaeraceae bacterium]
MIHPAGLVMLLLFATLTGCAHSAHPRLLEPKPVSGIHERYQVIGRSLEGRGIECHELGNGRELIVFIAGIHGSEPAGVPLVRQMAAVLKANPEMLEGRRVVIVSNANPDGLARGRRFNNNGIDLNRNFPARNHSTERDRHGIRPLSEPESRALYDLFKSLPRPARVITLHQPLECIDYDGPETTTLPLAEVLAATSQLPVNKLGSRPGSLGSWLGVDQEIPTITVEFYKADTDLTSDELWRKYGQMMLAAVMYPELPGARQITRMDNRFRQGS